LVFVPVISSLMLLFAHFLCVSELLSNRSWELTLFSVTAQSPPSDNDGGERPMRQQLKNTNIDSVNSSAQISRKRSLEDADAAADEHPTKRSREGTPEPTSQTAPASEEPVASTTQETENGPTVSESELADYESDPPETPLESDTQPHMQSPSGTSNRNADGKWSCAPISTNVSLPLEVAITITCAGVQTTRHLSIPLEVKIDLPSVESVRAASSVSGEAKSHISIPSGSSSASVPSEKGYSQYFQRDPDNAREPDVPRASSYPHVPPYPQVSPYPRASSYPQVSAYPQDSAHPQASLYRRAPQYPSPANYKTVPAYSSAASYRHDSDNKTQQKPPISDDKTQDKALNTSKKEPSTDQVSLLLQYLYLFSNFPINSLNWNRLSPRVPSEKLLLAHHLL
jgi:hypothetical protein